MVPEADGHGSLLVLHKIDKGSRIIPEADGRGSLLVLHPSFEAGRMRLASLACVDWLTSLFDMWTDLAWLSIDDCLRKAKLPAASAGSHDKATGQ